LLGDVKIHKDESLKEREIVMSQIESHTSSDKPVQDEFVLEMSLYKNMSFATMAAADATPIVD